MAILLQATTTLADLLQAPSSPLASVSSFSDLVCVWICVAINFREERKHAAGR
jgi:hypothetical protein